MLKEILYLLGCAYEFILFGILILNQILPANSFPDLRIFAMIGVALAIYIIIVTLFFFPE